MPAARRVAELAPGKLFTLLRDAGQIGALDLALGIPAAPRTPTQLIEFASRAMRDGWNQYERPDGNLLLRQHIAKSLPVATDPMSELTITVGATEALAAAVLATINPGDEVIVFEPFDENFLSAIALACGLPRLVKLRRPDWNYDPAELRGAFGPRTRAIMISTPNNPTGRVLSRADLDEIAELCLRWDVIVISDEIYSAFVFDGQQHVSACEVPALLDRSVVLGSLSKSQAVSGWRLGYLRAAGALSEPVRQVHTVLSGGAATPLQAAAAQAAEAGLDLCSTADNLASQRDRLVEIMQEFGMATNQPQGSCYLLGYLTATDKDSEATAYRLVRDAGVLVAPGQFFCSDGADPDARFVRMAFNRSLGFLDEVQSRLACYVSAAAR
ncbi:MAG: pyridoxal phosphate-dependent aminotransferase [Jatrophihabitans sp.]